MKDKYYTPEIEEFYLGFEYEIFEDWDMHEKKSWCKQIHCNLTSNPERLEYVGGNMNKFRVKYLDEKDIKSFGLNHIGGKLDGRTLQHFKGKTSKGYYLHITATKMSFGNILTIETSVYENSIKTLVVHTITIRNKSELKILLNQLNIT